MNMQFKESPVPKTKPEELKALEVFRSFRSLIEEDGDNEEEIWSKIVAIVVEISDLDLLTRLSGLLNNFASELKQNLRKPDRILGTAVDPKVDKKVDIITGIISKIELKIKSLQKDGVEDVIQRSKEDMKEKADSAV